MLFNSLEFILFLAANAALFVLFPSGWRWAVLLVASYLFYGLFSWWFPIVLAGNTLLTYFFCLRMRQNQPIWLVFALASNLGLLFFFKYFDFFSQSAQSLATSLGLSFSAPVLHLVMPIGISFFSFQAVAYAIDVHAGRILPERHLGRFAVFLAFFPKLLAGPIERGASFLPQLQEEKTPNLERILSGIGLFTWGVFKKVVIADRLGLYVDRIFLSPGDYSGLTLILTAYCFTIQIYADFSAYTDMARGCGRIFGFELLENFRFPYLARSIADFWRRWHISLTSWFRDYLYIPLGGNRTSAHQWAVNIMVVFLLSGLWHGANWTFVIWGGLHGFYYLFGRWTAPIRQRFTLLLRLKGIPLAVLQTLITFHLVALAWVFFRAENLQTAFVFLSGVSHGFSESIYWGPSQFSSALTWFLAGFFFGLEFLQSLNLSERAQKLTVLMGTWLPALVYPFLLVSIFLFGAGRNDFIYFHF